MKVILPYLTLFTSFGTLICCALPALFVSLGLGASLAALLGAVPGLIWFSEHKGFVFGGAALMLLLTVVVRRNGTNTCPSDPELGKACNHLRKVSSFLVYGSAAIFCVGTFFAFLAPVLGG